MEKFFKTGKAAKILGVSIKTLKRWRKKELITPAQVTEGGRCLYSETQLLEFKNGDTVKPDLIKKSVGDTYNFQNGDTSRDKNGDTAEKTASEQVLQNGAVEKTRYLLPEIDTIPPEHFQNGNIQYNNGVIAPLADNRKESNSEEIGDTSTKVISVNVIPTTKLIMPNDKFCKYFFSFSQDEYEFILKNGGTIEECKKSKVGKIYSDFDVVLENVFTSV